MRLGSKYKANEFYSKRYDFGNDVFECVYKTDRTGLTQASGAVCILRRVTGYGIGAEFSIEAQKSHNFIEYIEPHKEYFNAFRMTERTLSKGNITETRYQGPFNLEVEADHRIKDLPRGSYYGRLIMTHHSETEVTVEFHLKR